MGMRNKICLAILLVLGACKCPGESRADETRVVVLVAWPGAGPAEVEQALALPVETAVMGIKGVNRVVSRAREGLLTVVVHGQGSAGGVFGLLKDVRQALQGVSSSIPQDAEQPTISPHPPAVSAWVSLCSDLDPVSASRLADDLAYKLMATPGVVDVAFLGRASARVLVELDLNRLQAYGLSTDEVVRAISVQGLEPSGRVRSQMGEYLVRTVQRINSLSEMGQMVVATRPAGDVIRLADMAQISFGFDETRMDRVWTRNGSGLGLGMVLAPGESGAKAYAGLPERLSAFAESAPGGMRIQLQRLMPRDEEKTVFGRVRLEHRDKTDALEPLVRVLAEFPSKGAWFVAAGELPGFELPGGMRPQDGLFVLSVPSPKIARQWAERMNAVAGALPGLSVSFRVLSDLLRKGGRVEVLVSGDDLDALSESADKLERALRDRPGVAAVWREDRQGKPELRIEADRVRLAELGLSQVDLTKAVLLGTRGQEAVRLMDGARQVPVVVRLGKGAKDPADLIRLIIQAPAGDLVPFGSVAKIEQVLSPSLIQRINARRVIRLEVELLEAGQPKPEDLTRQLRSQLNDLPAGVSLQVQSL